MEVTEEVASGNQLDGDRSSLYPIFLDKKRHL